MTDVDGGLLAELGALLRRLDPLPPPVRADAEAAFALVEASRNWRWLKEITEPVTLVRSGARPLCFADGEVSVRLEVRRLPWRTRLVGLVSPAEEVEVRWPAGARRVRPDLSGAFRVDDLPRGPLRVVVGSRATRWFLP